MIPPRILKELAESLTQKTRTDTAKWFQERASAEAQRYALSLGAGSVIVHYSPSRGGPDTIELAVTDNSGAVIGSLIAEENEANYDLLADLLFEIQRRNDPGSRRVTDEILDLLKS